MSTTKSKRSNTLAVIAHIFILIIKGDGFIYRVDGDHPLFVIAERYSYKTMDSYWVQTRNAR